ncbi:MAG: HD domain-containing protein [Bacteroidota bacterium]|nr:phosphohydrolase [Odoribacter sp.]MDP3642964.1 HD domain-containing protein [Bacteroidota bacterium]
MKTNKNKIINDPVFGFINIRSELVFDLIEHPYFQRLRRIKQLGLSYLVYPGANHTRFEHALGALHLMRSAIGILRLKGLEITDEEADAVTIAILLHDIGHGPFSHALENTVVQGIPHERISLLLMEELNRQFEGKLGLAISIFTDQYDRHFLHQLVSSQLDMDRLDYLSRDSFFSGVSEGVISSERIIKMLHVKNDELVVEYKGIYSVENFLIARRLMYWQVYLHKTVLSAEYLLINVLARAREIAMSGTELFATPVLKAFLSNNVTLDDFVYNRLVNDRPVLDLFASLDDNDIIASIKEWQNHPDSILSYLSRCIINRRLFKIKISKKPISEHKIAILKEKICSHFNVSNEQLHYFLISDTITNSAYNKVSSDKINVLFKNNKVSDIADASDINLSVFSETVRKYFICYPKELDIK